MRKLISVLLICVFILCLLTGCGNKNSSEYPNNKESVSVAFNQLYKDGDRITFGEYPQSIVEDSTTVIGLNKLLNADKWISYEYNAAWYDLKTIPYCSKKCNENNDIMFQDVEYNGEKYRAVIFGCHRARWSECPTNVLSNYYDYGTVNKNINPGTTYWFKFEPIEWIILDVDKGLMITTNILDSQPIADHVYFSDEIHLNHHADKYYGDSEHTYYANNYEKSYIRQWLNTTFVNTAFSTDELPVIKESEVDNSIIEDKRYKISTLGENYFCNNTIDKVFLLSYTEVLDEQYGLLMSNGTIDTARQAKATRYAIYQGGCGDDWTLRTPGTIDSIENCFVNNYGNIETFTSSLWEYTNSVSNGIRPAICIDTTISADSVASVSNAE